jgi:ParB/RepB/Spo0J family partition protein
MPVKVAKGKAKSAPKKSAKSEVKAPDAPDVVTTKEQQAAQLLTEKLGRMFVDIKVLEPNPMNPNEMLDSQFNLLVDNIKRIGVTDPILVRPHPKEKGKFRIVGGEHRWQAAKHLGFTKVPVTIVDDKAFTEDEEKFQLVRHNVIHGKMSPKKFIEMYESLSSKYTNEIAAESFGFVSAEEFKKLLRTTASTLPPEMKKEFNEASKELKSLDDLAKLLNHLFLTYGDTLPYGYMIFDFDGKDSVWLRMTAKSKKTFLALADICLEKKRSLDHVMELILIDAMAKESTDRMAAIVAGAPEVEIKGAVELPTLDFLDKYL